MDFPLTLRPYVKEGVLIAKQYPLAKLWKLVFFVGLSVLSFYALLSFQMNAWLHIPVLFLLHGVYFFFLFLNFFQSLKERPSHLAVQDVLSRLLFQTFFLVYAFKILAPWLENKSVLFAFLFLGSLSVQIFFSVLRFDIYLYLVVGGLTTLVSISSFAWGLEFLEGKSYAFVGAQSFSFFAATLFAFLGQKYFVFQPLKEKTHPVNEQSIFVNAQENVKAFALFLSSRLGFSFVFEFALLYLWSVYHAQTLMFGKVLFAFVVLVLNYLISKYFIFRKKV